MYVDSSDPSGPDAQRRGAVRAQGGQAVVLLHSSCHADNLAWKCLIFCIFLLLLLVLFQLFPPGHEGVGRLPWHLRVALDGKKVLGLAGPPARARYQPPPPPADTLKTQME